MTATATTGTNSLRRKTANNIPPAAIKAMTRLVRPVHGGEDIAGGETVTSMNPVVSLFLSVTSNVHLVIYTLLKLFRCYIRLKDLISEGSKGF